jgi:hypothetical protein
MVRRFRDSMRQGLTYDDINVRKRKILSTANVPCKYSVVVIVILVTTIIAIFGDEEIAIAQSDNMSMNPIIMHVHPELSLFVNGKSLTVPAQIGIDPSMWKDHALDEFGMQAMPEMNMSAMAPLHTHDNSGVIHVESAINKNYTLGEFMNIWGLNINDKPVKMTANGKPVTNFRDYVLRDGERIRLEVQ